MEKYLKPWLEIEEFQIKDVITSSWTSKDDLGGEQDDVYVDIGGL